MMDLVLEVNLSTTDTIMQFVFTRHVTCVLILQIFLQFTHIITIICYSIIQKWVFVLRLILHRNVRYINNRSYMYKLIWTCKWYFCRWISYTCPNLICGCSEWSNPVNRSSNVPLRLFILARRFNRYCFVSSLFILLLLVVRKFNTVNLRGLRWKFICKSSKYSSAESKK